MFDGDIDINLLAVTLAKTIADGCDKTELSKIIHLLTLLQTSLRTYLL